MQHPNWSCPKCSNTEFETGKLRMSGGGFAAFFDVQNKKYSTLTCTRCRYTELYGATGDGLFNVLDFLSQ